MKSKLGIAVILGVLGLLTTLLVGIPMLSAVQGTATFLDGADGDEIDWTNPSNIVTLRVDDTDLDVPVKKGIYTASSADVTKQTGTVTTDGTNILTHSTSTDLTLVVGDTVLVDGETVRLVSARSGTSTTVSVAFTTSDSGVNAYKVNNPNASFANCPDCTAAKTLMGLSVEDGKSQTLDIADLYDLLDSNVGENAANRFDGDDADARINKQDVRIDLADGNNVPPDIIFSLDLSNGSITITNKKDGATPDTYDSSTVALYWFADANNTQNFVTVASEAYERGIGMTLTEIQTTGGAFEATLGMCQISDCSDPSSIPPVIEVGDNDVITLTYADPDDSDATGTITVEATEATFANESPVDLFATIASRPKLSIDVTDADSGIAVDSDGVPDITFVIQTTELDGTLLDSPATEDEPGEVSITGGHNVQTLVPRALTPDEDVYLIEWWVVAVDVAGNRSVSDNPAIEDSNGDQTVCTSKTFDLDDSTPGTAEGGCDPFQIRVDLVGPTMSSATTGNWFDTVEEVVESGSDAITTSIQVVFNEALDEDSISVGDFRSADVDIEAINWFADEPESVFLTVEAMDADDEPTIDLVANIADEAGNTSDDDGVDSEDGIPATLTVTVSGVAASRPITDEEITITVTSDEALVGAPSVTIYRVEDSSITAATSTPRVTLEATRTWEASEDIVGAGLYTVLVTGTDLGGHIETTLGLAFGTIDIEDEDGLFFEVDNDVAAPTYPLTVNDTDNPNTFISADFSNEANEYGLDGTTFSIDETAVDTSHDTHDTLTLISYTLDGVDVSADVSTTDNLVFLYKASDLALGEHEIVIEVEDEVANSSGQLTHTFEVTERATFEVPVVPGWNMISIPGDAADNSIDAVIGSTVPVTTVYSFYPSVPGGWLVAVREELDDGTFGPFAGTLTTINPNLGYWVLTSSFQAIEINIPQLIAGSTAVGDVLPPQPPSIDIAVGWNLVAVRDVTGDLVAAGNDALVTGTNAIDSDVYLAGLGISRVLNFDTLSNSWSVIVPDGSTSDTDGDDDLGVGRAYWLFATEAGTLVP